MTLGKSRGKGPSTPNGHLRQIHPKHDWTLTLYQRHPLEGIRDDRISLFSGKRSLADVKVRLGDSDYFNHVRAHKVSESCHCRFRTKFKRRPHPSNLPEWN